MLPLLPALILLLLNGPANIERLAQDGRLPAALAAVQGRLEMTGAAGKTDEIALASLLALGHDSEAAGALLRILASEELFQESPPDCDPVEDAPQEPPESPPSLGETQDGLGTCRNSRDGPSIR